MRWHRCVVLSIACCPVSKSVTVTDMFSEADDSLFRQILYCKTHVLHSYFDRPEILYSLRTRSRNKSLICKTSDLNDRNLLIRAVYNDCY